MEIEGPVVVTGAGGLLGSAFVDRLAGTRPVSLPRHLLDASEVSALERFLSDIAPRAIINCAADTDVEAAEKDPSIAFAVNADLAGRMAAVSARLGSHFVHFSSTGCYGNGTTKPFSETDPLMPTTNHHRSKADGEKRVLIENPDALILRLGWVFGGRAAQRKNFVWGRLLEAQTVPVMNANAVQVGSPTFTYDIVEQTCHLLSKQKTGVFNCVNDGDPVSRLDYIAAILEFACIDIPVLPIEFRRLAPVSNNESASNERLRELGLEIMPNWRTSLREYVSTLQADLDKERIS